jgi:hypothetical protein
MKRRVPASILASGIFLVSISYAPPVEAAGFSSVPATIGSYIDSAINLFTGLFSSGPAAPIPPAPVPASPSAEEHTIPASGASSTTHPPTTVINRTVYLPAASPALAITDTGVTQADLAGALATLRANLDSRIALQADAVSSSGGGSTNLTAADIPDLSGSYLSLTGGTITGNLTITGAFSGGALILANASTTLLSVAGPAYFGSTATVPSAPTARSRSPKRLVWEVAAAAGPT